MERKPAFTPWQVAVSEALRDGEAEKAIEAWHLRNRLHLCHDEEKTLTRLVDDWERHVKADPDSSTVILARTRAEARALSWLMRERVLAQTPDAKRAVIEVSRDLDGRLTEPLEIAVGDRIRIGATQWEKQLFNGTVVTVEDIEVETGGPARKRHRGHAQGPQPASRWGRRARGRGGGERPRAGKRRNLRSDHRAHRRWAGVVAFRHDEIRDWHDNIRLDYGYAMTIASAQGLTVDRAFLLVDDRPSRETIYPAATRHREALDIYVNRAPLAFDIAEHRPEDEADMPVTGQRRPGVSRRALVALCSPRRRRSTTSPTACGGIRGRELSSARSMGGPASERAESPSRGSHGDHGEGQMGATEAHEAANDNFRERIARDIRHAVNGWRHGAAVDAFAAERSEVMAAWDELRARVRDEGEAIALSPAFRETLDRHGALMKQAASFSARPRTFERLLSERAGIGDGELQEMRDVHARAGSYLRSVAARAAHTRRDAEGESEQARRNAERAPEPAQRNASAADAEGESEQARRDGEPAPEPARQTASAAETARPAPPAAQTSRDTGADAAPVRPAAKAPARSEAPGPDLSRAAYRRLRRDWGAHLGRAEGEGVHRFDLDGAGALVERIAGFTGSKALAAETRARLGEIVGEYRAHAAARDRVHGFLRDVERHWLRYHAISRRARNLDIDPQEQRSWPIWLERNERLLREGRAIIDDLATYRAHLDRIEDGHERLGTEVSRLERFSSAYRTQSRSRDRGPSRSM